MFHAQPSDNLNPCASLPVPDRGHSGRGGRGSASICSRILHSPHLSLFPQALGLVCWRCSGRWSLRLGENALLMAMRRPPLNPIHYLHRFFAQPRLRLAWTIAAARSSWWSLFYVYTPILAVTTGLGPETGGVVVSIGWIWLVP